jgi:hypothetical protein
MATTTPNFGWSVPTSSDLVKNGAVAIETLGDSIDASLVDLKGGTTGQVLSKASNTDMDFTWASGSLTSQSSDLGSTVTMTNANTYYDGPSITLAAGTWLIIGQVTIEDPSSTGGRNTAKLWNGTTVSSSLESTAPTGGTTAMTVSGIVAPTGSTTYKVSVASSQNSHTIRSTAPTNSAGANASHISAVKIG